MASVKPFKGVIYNERKLADLAEVVAPPYDIIPPDMQEALYRRHPYNIVRLILGKIERRDNSKDNRYTRAKRFFESWLEKKVMVQDRKRAIYIYSQVYRYGARDIERIGFVALMLLGKGRRQKVLAHENTLLQPKLDRLNLMRSVKANLSPIFVLYEDKKHKVVNILKRVCLNNLPFIDICLEGVRHRLWRLDEPHTVKTIEGLMRLKELFIADGHHRYEVALTYAAEIRDKPSNASLKKNSRYMMAYFVESDEGMLTILPAHRLIKDMGILKRGDIKKRLSKFFYMERAADLDCMMLRLGAFAKSSHAFGMYLGKHDYHILRMKDSGGADKFIKNNSRVWKKLDVTILHLFILQYVLGVRDEDDNVEFVKDAREAASLIDSGKFKIALFLNPTKVSQVKRIAHLGEKMPRKATYFYPKPLSGLVINKLGVRS